MLFARLKQLSANKTLQGIYGQWVFPAGTAVSRRAMHESVFESGWNREDWIVQFLTPPMPLTMGCCVAP